MKKIDYMPLNAKVSLAERLSTLTKPAVIGTVVLAVIIIGLILPSISQAPEVMVLVLGFAVIFTALMLITFCIRAGQVIRLRRFAKANQMIFHSDVAYDGRPGLIFNRGHSRSFSKLLTAGTDSPWEIGNYRYVTGSGKHQSVHTYGFVRIKLPRRLPHMLLDARKNNMFGSRISNLPTGFGKDQRLSLEGDFDKYFTLYAPAQYKRDALYIFTPDVMQALIDSAQNYDCEVIDDYMYIYSSQNFKLSDATQLKQIIGIIQQIRPELVDQADYYADERVGDRSLNIVNQSGARLKTSVSTVTVIIFVLVAIFYGWIFIMPYLAGR